MDEMDDVNVGETASETHDEEAAPLPPFYKRFIDVFFSPGRLMQALKEHPAWVSAMVAGAILATAMYVLIPADIWAEVQRQALLRSGRRVQEIPATAQAVTRWIRYISGFIGVPIAEFVFAGVVTLIFAFVMGDEGKYKQYLAVISHAWLITMTVELLLVPLKIHARNPTMTVSVGTFFFFLPSGYLLKALSLLALSKLWTSLVVAAGVHEIDPKRKFATAATVLIALNVAVAFITAIFTPSMG